MAAADVESRFAHLLKPIRDLTKNWDVDIAAQLEEYLEEIESITITFDNGQTSMNFAEAALLIQGSACVYSRKVEYLYSMVYEVLQTLASKKKLLQAGSLGEDGQDKDAPANSADQEDDFLTLDDIKEHDNIDLKNDDDNNTNVVKTIPRTPMALVKMDDAEKGENPLLSRTGEVLGNRFDFKMNTSTTHQTGMMLLDMSHLSMLEKSIINKPSSTPFHPPARNLYQDSEQKANEETDEDVHIDEGLPADISMEVPPLDFDADHQDDPMQEPDQEEPMVERRELRERRKVVQELTAKPRPDPWKIFDPHEVVTTTNKPFRKAKTFKLPPSIETEPSKKRKRKKAGSEVGKLQPITEFFAQAFFSASSRFPSNPLKAPSFPEFEQLYWKEFQRRQAKIRRDKKQLADQGRLEELAEEEECEEEAAQYPQGGDDDDGDFNPPEVADFNFPDVPTDPFSNTMVAEAPIVTSYEELVRQHVDGYLASAQQYAHVTELTKRVAEWEERIIPVLAEEDTHDPFDIHKYGTAVMTKCPPNGNEKEKAKKILFKKIAAGKPAFEVCRLFLATLQLANNYNVEIGSKGPLEEGVDTMTVKLLSNKRHFEELQDYQAPSLQT